MTARRRGHLFFDSAKVTAAMGVRGAGAEVDRTLVFLAGPICVDVMVHAGPDDYCYYSGQILDKEMRNPISGVAVSVGPEDDGEVETDEFGQFAIGATGPPDTRYLRVRADSEEVVCRVPSC